MSGEQQGLDALLDELCPKIAGIVRDCNKLCNSDLDFFIASSQDIGNNVKSTTSSLFTTCNALLTQIAEEECINQLSQLDDNAEELLDNYDEIVEITDNLLAQADTLMDEFQGTGKNYMSKKLLQSNAVLSKTDSGMFKDKGYIHAQNIPRPQLSFPDKVDNSNSPFVRKISVKPNARQPLDFGLPGSNEITNEMAQHVRSLGITSASSSAYSLPHPYEYEINHIEYPGSLFTKKEPVLYKSFDETPFTWVDSLDKLKQLVENLKSIQEVAVDLEHHDYRSYLGFTCLMQISTRTEDFLIDTLALRAHLHLLNECFTNPNIVKVLHGAKMDIEWLQKDFGVYVVNLFDTYHASHALEMGGHGLAYLLQHYCNIHVDKKYQLADWRIRPLPQEMVDYARADTHYLLYVFDQMRNELISQSNPMTLNLLHTTLDNSAKVSLRLFKKDAYDAETGEGNGGWKNAIIKKGASLGIENVAVFKAVHQWRDTTARTEDESVGYVLPNHMLFSIASALPVTVDKILKCCSPIPPLIRINAADLTKLIKNAISDAKQHAESRALEWQRIKEEQAAKLEAWAQKKAEHTRFDLETSDSPSAPRVKNTIEVSVKAKPSGLIIDSPEEMTGNLKKSIEIRENLVLVPPTFAVAKKTEETVQDSFQGKEVEKEDMEIEFTPSSPETIPEPESLKRKGNFIIGDIKRQAKKAKEEERAAKRMEKHVSNGGKQSAMKEKKKKVEDVITPFDYTNATESSEIVDSMIYDPVVHTQLEDDNTKHDSNKSKDRKLNVRPNYVKGMSFVIPK